jgi:hypothetical protein
MMATKAMYKKTLTKPATKLLNYGLGYNTTLCCREQSEMSLHIFASCYTDNPFQCRIQPTGYDTELSITHDQ